METIDSKILELLRREALTPDELAKRLNVAWSTANGHLLRLVGEGKAFLVRKGRVNIYTGKNLSAQVFAAPKWIKPKPLEVLSDELENYFPRNMTAADMIEKERRRA